MKFFKLSLLFVTCIEVVICNFAQAAELNGSCQLTIPDDISRNEPVYVVKHDNDFTIFQPSGHTNNFLSNEKFYLYCPGNKNSIQVEVEDINDSLTEVTCSDGKFQINDFLSVNNLDGINCTKGVQADIKLRKEKCSSTGQIIDVGFKLPNNIFLPTFEICLNDATWTPIWSKHVINGKSIEFNVKESSRRDFKATGLPTTACPSDAYKRATQINHFQELLGTAQTEIYFNSCSFLARGHLAPDADFVFPSAQWSTYFYLNTCPQFQSVNAGNWLRIENLARKLAQHHGVDMEIFTGVHETLKLKNSIGELKSMYLTADEKYEVPKWLWKVIKNTSTDAAIVLITLNDPFESEGEVEEFCTNVCDRANVDSTHFKTMKKGYTFCCDLMDFRRVVHSLPAEATAGKLLSCSTQLGDKIEI